MIVLATLYIGSNNETKELELKKIKQILEKHFEAFTMMSTAFGYYKGNQEANAVIKVQDDLVKIIKCVKQLKKQLKQDCIGIDIISNMQFI